MARSILLEVTSSTSFWNKKTQQNHTTAPGEKTRGDLLGIWRDKTTQMEPKPPESFNILQVGYSEYTTQCIEPTLRIQVSPKEGISPIILFWGWDLNPQSYSREVSGVLGLQKIILPNSHQNVLNIAKWYQSQRLVLTKSYEYIPPTESSVMGTLLAPLWWANDLSFSFNSLQWLNI